MVNFVVFGVESILLAVWPTIGKRKCFLSLYKDKPCPYIRTNAGRIDTLARIVVRGMCSMTGWCCLGLSPRFRYSLLYTSKNVGIWFSSVPTELKACIFFS